MNRGNGTHRRPSDNLGNQPSSPGMRWIDTNTTNQHLRVQIMESETLDQQRNKLTSTRTETLESPRRGRIHEKTVRQKAPKNESDEAHMVKTTEHTRPMGI
jgi:hypothetical protein